MKNWNDNRWAEAVIVDYEMFHYEGPMVLVETESETLVLKMGSQQVVNVPQNCTLSIRQHPANGAIEVTVAGETSQSWDAFRVLNRHDTTDPTKQ